MLRRLFRPDVLFLVGTLQGLLPFLLILLGGVPPALEFLTSYYAPAIWMIGYVSFWCGTKLLHSGSKRRTIHEVKLSLPTLKLLLTLLCAASLLEMVGLAKVYGGVPLLMFAKGTASVTSTNEAQEASGFGQVGIAQFTLNILVSALILFLIKCRQVGMSRKIALRWIAPAGSIAFILCVFNGKRQGLFMYGLVAAVAGTFALGSPLELLRAFARLPAKKGSAVVLTACALLLVIPVVSGFASLRNNGGLDESGLQELESYYFYPAMNLSLQCNESGGFGPFQLQLVGVIAPLLPSKFVASSDLLYSTIPRIEITSPSGFYERLQWYTGLGGVVLFPLLCGMCCQYMYLRASTHYAALLTYSLMAWALFSAPIYNHFLNLLFLPLPAATFWVASIVGKELKQVLGFARQGKIDQLRRLPSIPLRSTEGSLQ